MSVFDRVNIPADLKQLSLDELHELCGELRNAIIMQIAQTGGHFAAPLGAVELAVALHYVLDTPRDKVIWDVGHQAYAHKLLTGRKDRFGTLKKYGGLSGFLRRDESEYDVFGGGHASTSISAAIGVAAGRDLRGEDFRVCAVVGDGALTGGLCFEALNNLGQLGSKMLIVLNDNNMSIDENVGSMNSYLNRLISGEMYNRIKEESEAFCEKLPGGHKIVNLSQKIREFAKGLVTSNIFFEELGIRYFGPVDGHDIEKLTDMLGKIKNLDGPVMLHAITRKGKGYSHSEQDPITWHGPAPFKIESGEMIKKETTAPSYTTVFAKALEEAAEKDSRVVAITAAMTTGTGLVEFSERFPDRFFDVGIAEGHAVTYAAGLATEGIRPVCAIYSTFLQRAYDHILHDVALQKLPVVFALDRGGLVGADGPTHHGAYDFAYLRSIPGMVVMAPKDEAELRNMIFTALQYDEGPVAVRYPRGTGVGVEMPDEPEILSIGRGEILREGESVALLGVGLTVQFASQAADALAEDGIHVGVANMRFVKPLDEALLRALAEKYDHLITIEDHALMCGFGSAALEALNEMNLEAKPNIIRLGIPDEFIEHGSQSRLYQLCGFHPDNIAERVRLLLTDKVQVLHDNLAHNVRA
ncbi:1-deoxy-D-xylulose-5-phosphate synthase [Candidatus Sumerlaeota bacterium]|nr:1-deoxy-D-xylulose-5-phosphate synthase [Candidatus Sumerlaeota bacterium]